MYKSCPSLDLTPYMKRETSLQLCLNPKKVKIEYIDLTLDDNEDQPHQVNDMSNLLVNTPRSQESSIFAFGKNQDTTIDDITLLHTRLNNRLDSKSVPLAHPPGLNIELMPHQTEGVQFMLSQEKSDIRGGILADDMGLGKTIQSIATILSNPAPQNRKIKTTLIVTPVSIMHQWVSELSSKVNNNLMVRIHHSKTKIDSEFEIGNYDVIITSYGKPFKLMIVGSLLDVSSILYRVKFWRTILDECHIIKNPSSLISQACFRINSNLRWCLSGTPVQNKILDLYPLIRFMRMRPYNDFQLFKRKLNSNDPSDVNAMLRMKTLLQTCLLRRTKETKDNAGNVILTLPVRNVVIDYNVFSIDEKQCYDVLFTNAKLQFNRFVRAGTVMKNYSYILVLLLRLRQACLHPDLITTTEEATIGESTTPTSTKISRLVQLLQNVPQNEKVIVFSQFCGFLDLLHKPLEQINVKFDRYDGSMSATERRDTINRFTTTDNKVLLVSLKCGSLGLNLTCANHVILMDPWYNPTVENQAIDRVHRIGQKRDVNVHRIVIKDSIEDRILQLQDKKQRLADSVLKDSGVIGFGCSSGGSSISSSSSSSLSLIDLMGLFK